MNALARLQDWYQRQCNDDWEHTYGVEIGTLDNPGWTLQVDLADTELEGRAFAPVEVGIGADSIADDPSWLSCKVEGRKFKAAGGPAKLEAMILAFLDWAEQGQPNKSLERSRDR